MIIEGREIVFRHCFTCDGLIAMTPSQERGFKEFGWRIHCVLGHVTIMAKNVLLEAQKEVKELRTIVTDKSIRIRELEAALEKDEEEE